MIDIGLAPGRTSILASAVHQDSAVPGTIDIAMVLGAGKRHGAATTEWAYGSSGCRFPDTHGGPTVRTYKQARTFDIPQPGGTPSRALGRRIVKACRGRGDPVDAKCFEVCERWCGGDRVVGEGRRLRTLSTGEHVAGGEPVADEHRGDGWHVDRNAARGMPGESDDLGPPWQVEHLVVRDLVHLAEIGGVQATLADRVGHGAQQIIVDEPCDPR